MGPDQYHIPDDLLHELAGESHKKLIDRDLFVIRESGNMVDPIYALSIMAGWNQTRRDLEILSEHSVLKLLARVRHNRNEIPAGSGLVIRTGNNLVWIGMVLVHPELRRQGIATKIMIQCIEKLRSGDQPLVIGLDATPEGRPLYRHLGFEDSFEIQRFLISVKNKTKRSRSAAIGRIGQLRSIERYAVDRGFPNSKSYLKIMMDLSFDGECFLIKKAGKVTGFVMSRPGRLFPFIGPLMADDEETAVMLLNRVLIEWEKKGHDQLFIDIPERFYKRPGFSALDEFHVVAKRKFNRMFHLISPEKMNEINFTTGSGYPDRKILSQTMIEGSGNSYEATKAYMKNERENRLNYFFAIGGPEIS